MQGGLGEQPREQGGRLHARTGAEETDGRRSHALVRVVHGMGQDRQDRWRVQVGQGREGDQPRRRVVGAGVARQRLEGFRPPRQPQPDQSGAAQIQVGIMRCLEQHGEGDVRRQV
jgi:hypothetical protein